jgi:uncharacterized membrane protein
MKHLARWFVQGLLILVPLVVTAYVVWTVVTTLDGWVQVQIPGLGIVITLAIILLIGFLSSSVIGSKFFELLEGFLTRLPVVKLLYSSLRDLLHAFVGEKRSFGRPVVVDLTADGGVRVLGFLTCEHFDDPQLAGHVGIYLPQSYNFAGNLLVVPKERTHPVDADGAQFMAFIMSGGVAEMEGAKTMLDEPLFPERHSKP